MAGTAAGFIRLESSAYRGDLATVVERVDSQERVRRVALLYQPTSEPTFVATYRQILFPQGTWD